MRIFLIVSHDSAVTAALHKTPLSKNVVKFLTQQKPINIKILIYTNI